jgi:23S rRNA pseudouridine1911/1915/1917 synthase
VLADKIYGGRDSFKLSDVVSPVPGEDEVLMARQALHAFRLRFKHPRKGTWLEVEAPLPADMRKTLETLRTYRPVR